MGESLSQLRQRSTHRPECRRQEDHEALQHPRLVQEDVSRAEASEALEA
jgi:hypothetical protein